MIHSREARVEFASRSFNWFFHLYFAPYVQYETAEFQREIMRLLADKQIEMLVLAAFRGSGKSTIVSLAFVIWSIITGRSHYVLLTSLTQGQAGQLLDNIRQELENNELLIKDFGPFFNRSSNWRSDSLEIKKYSARISVYSVQESLRGTRYKENRPDLIVVDDVEDVTSVRSPDRREQVRKWLFGDVIPASGQAAKIVVVGNVLHEDSLVMYLKSKITCEELHGRYVQYPIVNDRGQPLWPGKFPNQAAIEREQKKVGSAIDWAREYELRIVSDEESIILPNQLAYYDHLPETTTQTSIIMAVDPAIGTQKQHDCTAIVSGMMVPHGDGDWRLYILSHPFNKRVKPHTLSEIVAKLFASDKEQIRTVLVEDVGYQAKLLEDLQEMNIPAEGVNPGKIDKRARLEIFAKHIIKQQVLFPKHGANELIKQLLNFGSEKHDDLVDALLYLIEYAANNPRVDLSIWDNDDSDDEFRPFTAGLLDKEF